MDPQDWERAFAAADRIRARDAVPLRERVERFLYLLDTLSFTAYGDVAAAHQELLEALYPENGGIPPWRSDGTVDVPDVQPADGRGVEGGASGGPCG
ncbi:MAG TPA: hypothetical protein VFP22_00570 [Candidatus Limnocylindrales bacterium]|nr:hypothetical protein [Candidatus Limnocylindrales bacterium]